jgi:peptide/nickel transport system substrate-binding protein
MFKKIILLVLLIVFLFSGMAFAQMYERSETLYTSGTQWGPPSSWNPYNTGGYAMGTFGLCYESLFLYDPLTNEYIPWLAESGEWISSKVYELKVREGVKWNDGTMFTAKDVKFTFDIAKTAAIGLSPIWNFLGSVDMVDDYKVQLKFDDPLYQELGWYIYNNPIIPEHIWASKSTKDVTSGIGENPVGTGAYLFEASDQSKMVWKKNPNWWANSALGLDPKPKYIIDLVNSSNNVALGQVIMGQYDLNNNFLPGIAAIVKGGYGIDVDQIVNVVYGNIVAKADPSGLLPIWDQYIDKELVKQLGFSYNPEKAKTILSFAGYKDVDGDGFIEAPDGSKIALSVVVPFGWSDWMESIKVVSRGCQAVGINLSPEYPDYPQYLDSKLNGTFDMMICNDQQMSSTPWTYYDWMFQNPIADIATMQNGNYGRYDNEEAFALADELDKVKVGDIEGMKAVISKLEKIQLTDLPLIPLWYNGMWSQTSNAVWTDWPSSAEDANHYLAATWRGYWNMTGILMLCDLEPAK